MQSCAVSVRERLWCLVGSGRLKERRCHRRALLIQCCAECPFAYMCATVCADLETPVTAEMREVLTTYIKKTMARQPIKIRCDVEVTCYTYEGIDAVRSSLMSGQIHGTPEAPIKIKLIAPPKYVMTTMILDKDAGVAMLNKV